MSCNCHGLGRLGDDPASVVEILAAGYDPNAPGVTYTVDANGNVMQNLTVTASAPRTASFPWPLAVVLALIGLGLFSSGRASR